MFVRQSVYDALQKTAISLLSRALQAERDAQLYEANYFKLKNATEETMKAMVEKVLRENGMLEDQKQVFSKEEIERLIRLCHPDRHEGIRQVAATEMTQKLLTIKKGMS